MWKSGTSILFSEGKARAMNLGVQSKRTLPASRMRYWMNAHCDAGTFLRKIGLSLTFVNLFFVLPKF